MATVGMISQESWAAMRISRSDGGRGQTHLLRLAALEGERLPLFRTARGPEEEEEEMDRLMSPLEVLGGAIGPWEWGLDDML